MVKIWTETVYRLSFALYCLAKTFKSVHTSKKSQSNGNNIIFFHYVKLQGLIHKKNLTAFYGHDIRLKLR